MQCPQPVPAMTESIHVKLWSVAQSSLMSVQDSLLVLDVSDYYPDNWKLLGLLEKKIIIET